ncbi:MAG: SCO family protein [Rhodocyclaceae bacterium]|nr:SCO family protein [Rhodocyclaceae bacterium]
MKRFLATLWLAAAASAWAVGMPASDSTTDPAILRIDEPHHLGQPLAGGTALVDAAGRRFHLGELFGKPTILLLSYFGCDGSCPTMNSELAKVLAKVERFRPGRDYNVLTVSFDARDSEKTAADFVARTVGKTSGLEGWRHAVLADRATERFAGDVGFRFFWSDGAKAFLHPNVIVFLTPEGRVARYLYGFRLDARNVELALIDADWGRIANSSAVFDMMTGACFSFNYAEGRYQWNTSLLAGIGSLLSGMAAIALGAWAYRRRRMAHG